MKRFVALIFLLLAVNLSAAQTLEPTLGECRALIAELVRQFAENCAETDVDQVCLSVAGRTIMIIVGKRGGRCAF